MDLEVRQALAYFRRDPEDGSSALSLCHVLSKAGLLPDQKPQEGSVLRCDLDNLGNATGHVTIGDTRLLLFHRTVVGVQRADMPAVINPAWDTVTTRKRIREWPFARHQTDLPEGIDFDDLVRFKAT